MAEYIDGTIIAPGHEFSFNDRVGPRTVERGFREGQMIIGSLLLPSIGGGVCQTATTLFNNAFELGLPIVERHNHSFYISHYPMGRDATVSWGGPDFAFKNDLKTGILIKTTYTELDADVHVLRQRSRPPRAREHRAARELALAADDLCARPVRAARLRAHRLRLEPVGLRRHGHPQGLRAREADAHATPSRAPTSRSGRRRSTARAARSRARTSCCRA